MVSDEFRLRRKPDRVHAPSLISGGEGEGEKSG